MAQRIRTGFTRELAKKRGIGIYTPAPGKCAGIYPQQPKFDLFFLVTAPMDTPGISISVHHGRNHGYCRRFG